MSNINGIAIIATIKGLVGFEPEVKLSSSRFGNILKSIQNDSHMPLREKSNKYYNSVNHNNREKSSTFLRENTHLKESENNIDQNFNKSLNIYKIEDKDKDFNFKYGTSNKDITHSINHFNDTKFPIMNEMKYKELKSTDISSLKNIDTSIEVKPIEQIEQINILNQLTVLDPIEKLSNIEFLSNQVSICNENLLCNNSALSNKGLLPNKSILDSEGLLTNQSFTVTKELLPNQDILNSKVFLTNQSFTSTKELLPNQDIPNSKVFLSNQSFIITKDLLSNQVMLNTKELLSNPSSIVTSNLLSNQCLLNNKELVYSQNFIDNVKLLPNQDSLENPEILNNINISTIKNLKNIDTNNINLTSNKINNASLILSMFTRECISNFNNQSLSEINLEKLVTKLEGILTLDEFSTLKNVLTSIDSVASEREISLIKIDADSSLLLPLTENIDVEKVESLLQKLNLVVASSKSIVSSDDESLTKMSGTMLKEGIADLASRLKSFLSKMQNFSKDINGEVKNVQVTDLINNFEMEQIDLSEGEITLKGNNFDNSKILSTEKSSQNQSIQYIFKDKEFKLPSKVLGNISNKEEIIQSNTESSIIEESVKLSGDHIKVVEAVKQDSSIPKKVEANTTKDFFKEEGTKKQDIDLDSDTGNNTDGELNSSSEDSGESLYDTLDTTSFKASNNSSDLISSNDDGTFDIYMKDISDNLKSGEAKNSSTNSNVPKSYDLREPRDINRLVKVIESTMSKGKSKLTITMSPENLGKMEIKLIESGGKITAKFFIDNESSHKLMLSHGDTIRNQLSEKGIIIDNIEFAFNDTTSKEGSYDSKKSNKGNHKEDYKDKVENEENGKEVANNTSKGIYA